MTKQQELLVGTFSILFLLLVGWLTFSTIQFRKTHYAVGSIPADALSMLDAKFLPLDALRPPALRVIDPVRFGNVTSTMSIIMYGSFTCADCRTLQSDIAAALAPYQGKIRFVWRDLPNDGDDTALEAAIFARCAGFQGKYWPAFDGFMGASDITRSTYSSLAAKLNLDQKLLSACRTSPDITAAIRQDMQESRADGILKAPLVFISTKAYQGIIAPETLKQVISTTFSSL